MNNKIFMLIGNIASGKSTWCKQFKSTHLETIIINDDAVVELIEGDEHGYSQKFKRLYKSIEDAILRTGIFLGVDIIVDRPHMSETSRKRVLGIASSLDIPVIAVMFKVELPEIHAKRRFDNNSRGHDYDDWLKVAHKKNKEFVQPTLKEGFYEICNSPSELLTNN